MKRLSIIILLLFGIQELCSAQKMPQWEFIPINRDSLIPVSLNFYDTLHGCLVCWKEGIDPPDVPWMIQASYYFETTDGGKSWNEITNPLFVGDRAYLPDGILSDYGDCISEPKYPSSACLYGTESRRYFFTGASRINFYDGRSSPNNGSIIHTEDGGSTWYIPYKDSTRTFYPLHTFSGDHFVVFQKGGQQDSNGVIFESFDGGRHYHSLCDSTYYHTINTIPQDTNFSHYGQLTNIASNISFDASDDSHWSVAMNGDLLSPLEHPPVYPMGLQMLITEDAGKTWQSYRTPIPGEDSSARTGGIIQFVKGTSNLYYFTLGGAPDNNLFPDQIEGVPKLSPRNDINWLYSTDYGKTWEIQRNFGDRRRAFQSVQENGVVWITTRKWNLSSDNDPATIIARTTDNGATWQQDSSTLSILHDGLYDGRIMTFTDPNHGWIAAASGSVRSGSYHTVIFRYNAFNQSKNKVIDDWDYAGRYYKIYPNPSSSYVHLQLVGTQIITSVDLYDIMGRKFFPDYHFEQSMATLSVHDYPAGAYIARVHYFSNGTTGAYTLPLVVQH